MHTLDIDIVDTHNLSTFRVTDNSSIDCNIPVEDGILEVFVPTFTQGIILRVEPKFSIIFNCANLKLVSSDTSPLPPLPDGAYRVHYSVKPNAYVYVDYIYYRNLKLIADYLSQKNCLYTEKCSLSSREFDAKRTNLNNIKDLLDAAKYAAEDVQDLQMASDLYGEAKALLARC